MGAKKTVHQSVQGWFIFCQRLSLPEAWATEVTRLQLHKTNLSLVFRNYLDSFSFPFSSFLSSFPSSLFFLIPCSFLWPPHRLPSKTGGSPSLEAFKTKWDWTRPWATCSDWPCLGLGELPCGSLRLNDSGISPNWPLCETRCSGKTISLEP